MFEKFILFTTPMCPTCTEIKEWVEESGKAGMVEVIDATTPEGKEKAAEYSISRVPTMVSLDKSGQKAGEAFDLDSIEEMLENKTLKDY
ncbi:glutaredoxin family protein [Candidatus Woesearchaeota archaeon]|nr:glutaredoxin family protein [Candidatus Woesearchaeota archaeon]